MNKFKKKLKEAMADIATHGFDSMARIDHWQMALSHAFLTEMGSQRRYETHIRSRLTHKARKVVSYSTETERRIAIANELIAADQKQQMEDMLRRFTGWATSIPKGGTRQSYQKKYQFIASPLAKTKQKERFVIRDQGQKLTANLKHEEAVKNHAKYAIWHSNWRKEGYDYRKCHKERDGIAYGLRPNGPKPYTDEIEMVGEFPNCRCWYEYRY